MSTFEIFLLFSYCVFKAPNETLFHLLFKCFHYHVLHYKFPISFSSFFYFSNFVFILLLLMRHQRSNDFSFISTFSSLHIYSTFSFIFFSFIFPVSFHYSYSFSLLKAVSPAINH